MVIDRSLFRLLTVVARATAAAMEIDCEAVDSIQVCRNECRREIFEAMGMLVPLRTVADFQRVCFDSEGRAIGRKGLHC